MEQGEQQARTADQLSKHSSPDALEDEQSDPSKELAEIMARSAAYRARPWHRKALDALDGFRPSNVLLFLDSIKPLIGFAVLILVVFAWTNWYFSPERRLLRLTERMNRASGAAMAADRALWTDLRPKSGSGSNVLTHCGYLDCSASMSTGYTLQSEKTLWLKVEVQLEPVFGDLVGTTLLPAPIRWREKAWRWSVIVWPRNEVRAELAFHGDVPDGDNLTAFSKVTQAFGTETIGANLVAMANDMAHVLAENNKP